MSNINIRRVKDAVTKEEFYPQTCIEAVVDENGESLGIDASPTEDSDKLVRSGGVKAAIDNEATARANADSALGIRIDGANTGIQAAMAAVSAEQQRAVQAENAKYVKPAGGIPKVDLASDVRNALDLATDVVYDISAHNNNTAYADLAAALGTGGANIPQAMRKGGMSVKYVQSSDNNSTKYVQYRLMSDTFSTTESDWQGVDEGPVADSDNLVKSGGVAQRLNNIEGVTYTDQNTSATASSKWENNNGTIGNGSSSITKMVAPITIVGNKIELSSNLDWAYLDVAYFCNDNGDIVQTVAKNNTGVAYSGPVPEGATKLYINYAVSFTCKFYGEIDAINGEIDAINGEIDAITPKVDETVTLLGVASINLEVQSSQRRWEESNGKVVFNDSTAVSVTSFKPVAITPYAPYSLTVNTGSTASYSFYVTDAEDNILYTGPDKVANPGTTYNRVAEPTAAKIYINSVITTGVPALSIGESVFKHLASLDEQAKREVLILSDILSDTGNIGFNIPVNVGDVVFITGTKKFYKVTAVSPVAYEEVASSIDVLYLLNSHLYIWNGTDLVSASNEQVIYVTAFSASAPPSMSKGDYYYNTNTKKLYRNNGYRYNNTEVPLSYNAVYLYNKELYLYNGTELFKPIEKAVNDYQSNYGAQVAVDNTTPLALTPADFEPGNLNGTTGAEISATKVIRSGFIPCVPSSDFTFSTSNSYRCDVFAYGSDKTTYYGNKGWKTGTYQGTLRANAKYIRIVVASPSGVQTAPVWNDAALSYTPTKVNAPARAAAEATIPSATQSAIESFFDLEMPIYAPSPQLPANDVEESDFNAETVTAEAIYTALDNLMGTLTAPQIAYRNTPKFLTKYEVSGTDASGDHQMHVYVMGLRNRYAWRYANELYAWKAESDNVVYVDSCSPRVGDTIYSSAARADSGKTVASYNSATGVMVDSSSVSFTRDAESNVDADMFWTSVATMKTASVGDSYSAYNRAGTSLGSATYVDATHLSLNGKTYTRSECFDFHTQQKATIFIWGNEHGPTSDPLEPSIILYRLAKDMSGGCRNNPFLMFLKKYCKIVFIPCANPYGCSYPRVVGRKNSNGVNLNRNYDTPGWATIADTDKGSYAGDQPETQYIMNMCKRFTPDIAVDIHCYGFGNPLSEGQMLTMGERSDIGLFNRLRETLLGLGFYLDYGEQAYPESQAEGFAWIYANGYIGGLFEMNAGAYSDDNHTYNGGQHTAAVMEANYTELLNVLRWWYYQFDPALDLAKMCIK